MDRLQLIATLLSLIFLFYISRLVLRNKLREEYSILWICCAVLLLAFSFYERGLEIVAGWLGFAIPSNLVFSASIFAIFIYLLHLSVVASKLQRQNKQMAQKMALLERRLVEMEKKEADKKNDI